MIAREVSAIFCKLFPDLTYSFFETITTAYEIGEEGNQKAFLDRITKHFDIERREVFQEIIQSATNRADKVKLMRKHLAVGFHGNYKQFLAFTRRNCKAAVREEIHISAPIPSRPVVVCNFTGNSMIVFSATLEEVVKATRRSSVLLIQGLQQCNNGVLIQK